MPITPPLDTSAKLIEWINTYIRNDPTAAFQQLRMNTTLIELINYVDNIIITGGGEPTVAPGTIGDYYRGDKTWQPLNKNAVGLGLLTNLDNTNAASFTTGYLNTVVFGPGTIPINALATTGTPSASTVLHGDGSWGPGGGGGFVNPMIEVGDIIVGTTAGAAIRKGVGTDNQVLLSHSANVEWSLLLDTIVLGPGLEADLDVSGSDKLYLRNVPATQTNGTFFGFVDGDWGMHFAATKLMPVGSSPNANAATLFGNELRMQPASQSNPGVILAIGQTLFGDKNFIGVSYGLQGQGGTGVIGIGNSVGVLGSAADGGLPAHFTTTPASTTGVIPIVKATRLSSGTAANGLGASYDVFLQTSTGAQAQAGSIQVSWTDATHASRASVMDLTVASSSGNVIPLSLFSDGYARLNAYTTTKTRGTIQYLLGVNADGDIITTAVGGGGGASISDTAFDASWNGDTTNGASKNALYDIISTLGGAQNLESVTTTGNSTTLGISFSTGAGTGRSLLLDANSVTDNFASLLFRPSGTNGTANIDIVPTGTGFSSGNKGTISLFNTDAIADGSNFEVFRIRAAGTSGYLINSSAIGTGVVRDMNFQTGGTTRLSISGSDGTIRFYGAYAFPNANGTSGQVLAWPSSGSVLEWADVVTSGDMYTDAENIMDTTGRIVFNGTAATESSIKVGPWEIHKGTAAGQSFIGWNITHNGTQYVHVATGEGTVFNSVAGNFQISLWESQTAGSGIGGSAYSVFDFLRDTGFKIYNVSGDPTYINLGNVSGESGIGFRESSGIIQYKNISGSWLNLPTSGTWTPTITLTANATAGATSTGQYMRVGSVVTASGSFSFSVTSGSLATEGRISLPVASSLANDYQLSGTAFSVAGNNIVGKVFGDATNDAAKFAFLDLVPGAHVFFYHFTYQII